MRTVCVPAAMKKITLITCCRQYAVHEDDAVIFFFSKFIYSKQGQLGNLTEMSIQINDGLYCISHKRHAQFKFHLFFVVTAECSILSLMAVVVAENLHFGQLYYQLSVFIP